MISTFTPGEKFRDWKGIMIMTPFKSRNFLVVLVTLESIAFLLVVLVTLIPPRIPAGPVAVRLRIASKPRWRMQQGNRVVQELLEQCRRSTMPRDGGSIPPSSPTPNDDRRSVCHFRRGQDRGDTTCCAQGRTEKLRRYP